MGSEEARARETTAFLRAFGSRRAGQNAKTLPAHPMRGGHSRCGLSLGSSDPLLCNRRRVRFVRRRRAPRHQPNHRPRELLDEPHILGLQSPTVKARMAPMTSKESIRGRGGERDQRARVACLLHAELDALRVVRHHHREDAITMPGKKETKALAITGWSESPGLGRR